MPERVAGPDPFIALRPDQLADVAGLTELPPMPGDVPLEPGRWARIIRAMRDAASEPTRHELQARRKLGPWP
jgi:hypothetical protein